MPNLNGANEGMWKQGCAVMIELTDPRGQDAEGPESNEARKRRAVANPVE